MTVSPRRFSPPRTVDEANAACFIARDANGRALGYIYFEQESGRRAAAKLLTKEDATFGSELRQAAGAEMR